MPKQIKTIIQRACGYSSQPVTATVQIDGVTILQGAIPTLDAPPPQLPDVSIHDIGSSAWSWTVDASFDGTQTMTISVDNGVMYLSNTSFTLSNDETGNVYPLSFIQQQGNLTVTDPFTNVTINGVEPPVARGENFDGQWVWQLPAGTQFTCTVNIESSMPTETP